MFADDYGMVLTLKKYHQKLTYFNCELLSSKPFEKEKLFIGGLGSLRISDICFKTTTKTLKKYLMAITWTKDIIEARLLSFKIDRNKLTTKVLNDLLNQNYDDLVGEDNDDEKDDEID